MKTIDSIENRDTVHPDFEEYHVVLRSGRRVSDLDHTDVGSAQAERDYWSSILRRWPDGTKMSIKTCRNINYSAA